MRVPTALRDLDDKLLGDRGRKGRRHRRAVPGQEPGPGDDAPTRVQRAPDARRVPQQTGRGAREALRTVLRVSALVLLLLAAAIGLGALFLIAPTNDSNSLVSGTLDLADRLAGPFRDVFTNDDAETERVVNYAFAAGVHLVGAAVLSKVGGRLTR